MPRRPRIILPEVPLHLIQRGHNRQACFFSPVDYQTYLGWLQKYAQESNCAVHAYVLMTNHVHLLVTPQTSSGASDLMKHLGQRYAQYINRTYRRSGALWEGRFRSCLTQEANYVLACYRYIELNPVRANIVAHPADYPWSSCRGNAQGEVSKFLVEHLIYPKLDSSKKAQCAAYRALFQTQLAPGLVDEIRKSTNGNYALGSARFQKRIASMLGRRVTPGNSGRPRKGTEPVSISLFDEV